MTTEETLELVRFLLAAYPAQRSRMSGDDAKAMVAAYHAGLGDIETDRVRAAAARVLRVSKWIPSVAEIREALGVVESGERRHGIEAWGDVLAMRTFRDRETMELADPLVIQICRSFGWIEWRTKFSNGRDIEQWHVVRNESEASDRARFAEAYDKLTATARKEAQASPGAMLPAPAREAVAQLETLAGGLAAKLTSGQGAG